MDAATSMELLTTSPIGDIKSLPTSEAQCRELACVPKRSVPTVWNRVCEQSEQEQVPITGVGDELRPAQTVLAKHKAYRQRNAKADAAETA